MLKKINSKIDIGFDSILTNIDFFVEPIPVKFKEIDFGSYLSYEFEFDKNIYHIDFYFSKYDCDAQLIKPEGKVLREVIGGDCNYYELIDCFEINLSFIGNNELNSIDLFGRIVYILNNLISSYRKVRLFVIKDINKTDIEYFKLILGESFFDYFDLIFSDNIMFLVRKKINR
jgi:hypothetical protein